MHEFACFEPAKVVFGIQLKSFFDRLFQQDFGNSLYFRQLPETLKKMVMKVIISTLLAVFCLTSCNTSRKENPKEQAVQKPLLEMGCYAYHKNGDTINFKINQEDDNITGTLKIAYAEKDANKGTFEGVLKGDTLMGTYTFKSEGRRSEREIAFLIKGNQLIEGYGKMTENGTALRDKNSIKFPPTMPLTKVDCAE